MRRGRKKDGEREREREREIVMREKRRGGDKKRYIEGKRE